MALLSPKFLALAPRTGDSLVTHKARRAEVVSAARRGLDGSPRTTALLVLPPRQSVYGWNPDAPSLALMASVRNENILNVLLPVVELNRRAPVFVCTDNNKSMCTLVYLWSRVVYSQIDALAL